MARMISLTKMKTRENALGDWKYFYIVKGPKTRFLKDGYRWDSLGSRPEIAAARFGIPISNPSGGHQAALVLMRMGSR